MSKRLSNMVFLITYTDKIYFIMKFEEQYNKKWYTRAVILQNI